MVKFLRSNNTHEKIPYGWHVAPTLDIMKIVMGQSPPSTSYNCEQRGLPFYQGVTDFGALYPSPSVWCTDPRKTTKRSILFSVRAPVGEINITKEKCCLGRGVAALEPKGNDLLYCYYLVKYYKRRFLVYSQGTTYDSINRDQIASTHLPYTKNIREQQKIASILFNIDMLIEITRETINKLNRLKLGLMRRLLTKGVNNTQFKKALSIFGKFELIPYGWHVAPTLDIMKIVMGQSPPSTSYNCEQRGLPFYQGVTDFGALYPSPSVWCTDPRKTTKRSILFSVRAPVGEINITKEKCCLGRGVAALEPKGNDLLYCYYLVKYYKRRFLVYSQGTTYDSINRDQIASTHLPYTKNIREQQKIASILSTFDSSLEAQSLYIKNLSHLKMGLMNELFTGKIRTIV